MKKLIILLLLITALLPAAAQNANRKGFFIELGAGALTGKTPRVSISMNDDRAVFAHFAKGMAADFYFGVRFRTGSHWAYEFRAGASAPLDALTVLPVPKAFPIGFRYTSGELFGNMSLYAHCNLGAAMTARGTVELVLVPGDKHDVKYHLITGGPAISAGIGLNITTHFYAGVTADYQYLFGCYRELKKENILWGNIGLRLGYRF